MHIMLCCPAPQDLCAVFASIVEMHDNIRCVAYCSIVRQSMLLYPGRHRCCTGDPIWAELSESISVLFSLPAPRKATLTKMCLAHACQRPYHIGSYKESCSCP